MFYSAISLVHFEVIGAYNDLPALLSVPVERSEEDTLGLFDLSTGVGNLGIEVMAPEASDADLLVVNERVKDELVLLDQGLHSGEMVLLALEREGMVEHLVGLDLQDLLIIDADMALVVNGLVVLALLREDLWLLMRPCVSDFEDVSHVLHERVVASLLGSCLDVRRVVNDLCLLGHHRRTEDWRGFDILTVHLRVVQPGDTLLR